MARRIQNFRLDLGRLPDIVQRGAECKRAVGAGVNRHIIGVLLRERLQVNGPENTAKNPVVGQPLGVIDRSFSRHFADFYFE